MLRERLRHSWLENQIILRRTNFISLLYLNNSNERHAFEERIKSGGEFDSNLHEARVLQQAMVDGFSPARLVDSGPLIRLPEDVRSLMKDVLHKAYLAETQIDKVAASMEPAIEELAQSIKHFSGVWFQGASVDSQEIETSFRAIQDRAKVLHEILGSVPRGIVLP